MSLKKTFKRVEIYCISIIRYIVFCETGSRVTMHCNVMCHNVGTLFQCDTVVDGVRTRDRGCEMSFTFSLKELLC